MAKKRQTHRYRQQTSDYKWGGGAISGGVEEGGHKLLGIRQAQECIYNTGNIANISQ